MYYCIRDHTGNYLASYMRTHDGIKVEWSAFHQNALHIKKRNCRSILVDLILNDNYIEYTIEKYTN